MNVIQGGPTPVVTAAPVAQIAPQADVVKDVLPAVAVKAAAKSEAASTGPRYAPHSDGELRGRRVNILA
jgi:hypothetical protein